MYRWRSSLVMLAVLALALTVGGCGDAGSECRIYMVNDSSGSFNSLYVVESPANGAWGDNLLVTVPPEYVNTNWRVLRFKPDRSYDIRINHTIRGVKGIHEESNQVCNSGRGIKYSIDGGYLFTITFSFEK